MNEPKLIIVIAVYYADMANRMRVVAFGPREQDNIAGAGVFNANFSAGTAIFFGRTGYDGIEAFENIGHKAFPSNRNRAMGRMRHHDTGVPIND